MIRAQCGSGFGIAALIALAWVSNRYTNFDLVVTAWFYDGAQMRFPLRDDWFWSVVLHDGQKWLAVCCVLLLLVGMVFLERYRRMPGNAALRSFFRYTVAVALICAAAVALAKASSAHSCPWHLSIFGGHADYFRLADPVPAHSGPGRCLPSGHSSSAFMWIAAIYASRRWLPQYTRVAFVAVIVLGIIAGTAQIARGAHFLSHILLTAALCWAICWIADGATGGWRLPIDERQ